jgi:hypothetical protein
MNEPHAAGQRLTSGDDTFARFFIDIGDRDGVPLASECEHRRFADAVATAGHDGDFIVSHSGEA